MPDQTVPNLAGVVPETSPAAALSRAQDMLRWNDRLEKIMPWATSLILHAGIILLTVLVVWTTVVGDGDVQVIIPAAAVNLDSQKHDRLSGGLSLGSELGTPGLPDASANLPSMMTSLDNKSAASGGVGPGFGTTDGGLSIGNGANDERIDLIAFGAGGGGNAGASPFAPGGVVGQGDGLFRLGKAGLGGDEKTRSVAFVIDASGSLVDTLPFVIKELNKSLVQLGPQQLFTVIFFHQGSAIEVPPAGLKRAGEKDRAMQWMKPESGNIHAEGSTTPMPALQLALRYKPNVMFILSDNITGKARYEIDPKTLLNSIKNANYGGTKINTIQFLYPDQFKTLELIAEQNGGEYRFVDHHELGIE